MNLEIYRPLIDAYLAYYPQDMFLRRDSYKGLLTLEKLSNLSKDDFVEFFYKFHHEGGKVQSGGHRKAGEFKKMLEANYKEAREFLLEPFSENFEVVPWLNRRTLFKPMGEGFITSYLIRINPEKYTMVNNKSIKALRKLGYKISGDTATKYQSTIEAENDLMRTFPELENYFMIDGLTHFIEGEDEGKRILGEINGKESYFKRLITAYMDYLRQKNLSDEIYKWQAIKHFQEVWKPDVEDFGVMFENAISQQSNLMNFRALSVIKHFCRNNSEELREMILILYDEDYGIEERIKQFQASARDLITKSKPEWKDSQDERAISVYLTLRYPEKYIQYKNSFYKKLAANLDEKVAKPGNKFVHYQEIATRFKNDFLLSNSELLSLYREVLPGNVYQDVQSNLLTQDVLYFMENRFNEEVNYWVFQCNPTIYNIENALRDHQVISWSVKAHKDKIMEGDKVILWVTGEESGCYALAKVDSEVYYDMDTDDEYYHEPHKGEESDRVELFIEKNLWQEPIPKELLLTQPTFENFNGGKQGTNFEATKKQYELILELINQPENLKDRRYWLYSPGEHARYWDEFYEKGIMAIGWDSLGNLNNFKSKKDIRDRLEDLENSSTKKTNDALTCFEFARVIKKGDIIIAKEKSKSYIGYGIVTSDYYYDTSRKVFQQVRKVDWKSKGKWEDKKGTIVQKTLTDITKYPDYVKRLISMFGINEMSEVSEPIVGLVPPIDNRPKNIILYGPPGTGKTYESIDLAVNLVDGIASDDHKVNKIRFDELREIGQIEFITFHQNYAYEDFVVGLRPDHDSEVLHFRPHKGIFYKICQLARENHLAFKQGKGQVISFENALDLVLQPIQDEGEVEVTMPSGKKFWLYDTTERTLFFRKSNGSTKHSLSINTLKELESGSREMVSGLSAYYQPLIELIRQKRDNPDATIDYKRFVLIIDEINRANISRVFGELITLLEEDKRLDGDNELKVTLPSGEKNFTVPPNLFLIGTMNTADKSIALLDIALRRRFEFIGKYPKYEKLTQFISEKLRKLNEAIKEAKKSPDFMIGHAYFINRGDADFKQIMNNKVIPLLYEYFNGRESFVKEVLDKAELEVVQNQFSHNWEMK